MLHEMKVLGLTIEEKEQSWIVVLGNEERGELLPIWIGQAEAHAIGIALEGIKAPRPLSHDLMCSLVTALGAKVVQVVVSELRESTYYAYLELEIDGRRQQVDCRPSDGIALALRCKAPVKVEEAVIASARAPSEGRSEEAAEEGEEKARRPRGEQDKLREWLRDLKPEDFGKFKM